MKRIAATAIFLIMAFGLQAQSQDNLRAEPTWYGLYTSGEVKAYDDPTSPTGKKHLSSGIKGPAVNSDRIEIVSREFSFGFGYRLTGPTNGTRVRTTHIYRFPGNGVAGSDGKLMTSTTVVDEDLVGDEVHIGWRMNGREPKEYEGVWTLQVWSDKRLLLERQFTLYRR